MTISWACLIDLIKFFQSLCRYCIIYFFTTLICSQTTLNYWTIGQITHYVCFVFYANYKDLDYAQQVGLGHYYHVCFEGCLANFEIGGDGVEATELYPEVKYTSVEDYMKRYVWRMTCYELWFLIYILILCDV